MNTSRIISLATSWACVFAVTVLAQPSRSVWDGVYTQAQADRGASLYSTECASCHGLELGGGEMAPPLAGGAFLSNWSGLTVGDLFDRIRQSMPADRPGSLSREKNADILAHILRMNQFPAGSRQLDHQSELLKQIRLEMAKQEDRK